MAGMWRKLTQWIGQSQNAPASTNPQNKSRYQFICFALAYVILAAVILGILGSYTVNWPIVDDFASVLWFKQMVHQKMISLSYLWRISDEGHPLATQALLSTALFSMVGINFRALNELDALIVLGSAITLSSLLLRQLGASWPAYLGSFVLLLAFFQPIQMSHLLWSFELGWFLINLLLVVNAVVLESSLKYGLAVVFVFCIIGTFSSAQGTVLWAAVAFQLFLKDRGKYKYLILLFTACFGLSVFHVLSITPKEVTRAAIPNIYGIATYFVQVLGTLFWSRDHNRIWWTGLVTLTITVVVLVHAFKSYKSNKIQRVSLVIMAASLIFTLEFASARLQLGIDWVLTSFHMASLLIPLLAGIVISSADWFATKTGRPVMVRLAVLVPCIYVAASFAYSVAPALRFAKENKIRNELARHFACEKDASPSLVFAFNLSVQHKDLYSETMPLLQGNCKAEDSWRTKRLLAYPDYFTALARQRPEARDALLALWQVYLINFDLSRAFPPTDPKRGQNLLAWAASNARSGSLYSTYILKPHAQEYLSLAQP